MIAEDRTREILKEEPEENREKNQSIMELISKESELLQGLLNLFKWLKS